MKSSLPMAVNGLVYRLALLFLLTLPQSAHSSVPEGNPVNTTVVEFKPLGRCLEVNGKRQAALSFFGSPRFLELRGGVLHSYQPLFTVLHDRVPETIGGSVPEEDVLVVVQHQPTKPVPGRRESEVAYSLVVLGFTLVCVAVPALLWRAAARHWDCFRSWLAKDPARSAIIYVVCLLGLGLGICLGDELARPFVIHDVFIDNATDSQYVVLVDSRERIMVPAQSHLLSSLQTGRHEIAVSAIEGSTIEKLSVVIPRELGPGTLGGGTFVYNVLGANSYEFRIQRYAAKE